MSKDLTIIDQLSTNLGRVLKKSKSKDLHDFIEEVEWGRNVSNYLLDSKNSVIGLCLKYFNLNSVPPEVFKLKNLQSCDFYQNKIRNLPNEIYSLKKLEFLFLGENLIKKIPSGISKLNNLKALAFHRNKLELIPEELFQLKNLEHLALGKNNIKVIPEKIFELSNLKILYLEYNEIREIPPSILKFNPEIVLQTERHPLKFRTLKKTVIILGGNPLESPPIEIIEEGNKEITDYFESLEGEKEAINEVKVILVGDGGSGKTSLVKQLLGEKFNKNESQTHGINIRDWNAKMDENDIIVHFWDFGGQEIMHHTHQFFLSERSLYILVLDGRKDEKTEYWLKHIESFGGDSPILVVLNKIDQHPAFDVNRKFLKEKYRGIKNFFRVSCLTQHGIKDFSDSLVSELSSVEILEITWAKSWFNIKSQLEKMQHPFISFKEYNDLCHRENIIGSKETLVKFLHDLGVIMHFSDIQLLDTHVLDPKWVTDAVYKIINSKELAGGKGILKTEQLNEVLKRKRLNDYYYPPDKYGYIINLMMKFELCYEIDKETILIPDLLEIQQPEFDFPHDDSLNFRFVYDFLPKSVIPRFIVIMHRDIFQKLNWRTGVILKDDDCNCIALIKADERDKNISISVNGDRKRDYFSVIRKTIKKINESFVKLQIKEFVPLPEHKNLYIEYDELIGYEFSEKKKIFIGKIRKEYTVSELLNGITIEDDRKREHRDKQDSKIIHIHDSEVTITDKKVKDMSKIKFEIGDDVTFHGDFMVGNKIKVSFNKAKSSNVSDDLKELLKTLSQEVAKLAEELPKDQAEKVAKNLQTFTNEATSEKPDKEWWELSAKGMKKAAKTVGEIGLSVIKNLDKIIPILEKIP